jgi:hypothetical protein
MSTTELKVHENRLRRMAARQGLRLEKSRARDPQAVGYATYQLVNQATNEVVASGGQEGYGLDLAAVEKALNESGSTVAADVRADIVHLLDLLDLLPSWDEQGWWLEMEKLQNPDPHAYYFSSKIHATRNTLTQELSSRQPSAGSLVYAAQHMLMFFDTDRAAVFKLLDRVAGYGASDGRAGRLWAQDAVATAWRLYVPARAEQARSVREDDPLADTPPWMRDGWMPGD